MILPSTRCSMMWAAQPDVRLMTNSGVNIAVGTPIRWYDTAENQSRFGNIFLTSCITGLNFEGHLVGAAVFGSPQGTDGACDTGIEIRPGAGDHPRREGGRVEL